MTMTFSYLYQTIQKQALFKAHHRVLIAVSGGSDSMTLLQCLNHYQSELNIELGIAHVNHKQRPESDQEEAYLKHWAKEHDIPIYVSYFSGKFTEKAARDQRYAFFKEVMQENDYTALVTAHHADDQAETILMRLIRGSRLRHLSGIKMVQPFGSGQLIRPFLQIRKTDLPATFHFPDSSNAKDTYFRNRVRNTYLPSLQIENKAITTHLLALSEEADLLFQALTELTATIKTTNLLDFQNQSRAVQTFLLQDYLTTFPDLQLSKRQFNTLLDLLNNDKT